MLSCRITERNDADEPFIQFFTMADKSPSARKRNVGREGAESRTTEIMNDKKAYKTVKAPQSWRIAFNYGLPAVAILGFIIAVATGYYDLDTFKSLWVWAFRMIKGLFAWDD
ncbi:hypothetical protein BV898_18614 [Hypsibius exemplaris]|uniref:Uncharacterized protein n=1 Tax=Hypsibius exemplaris TaxID=2072580 RepID=A0A9X6RNP7_HYPEX|nr:hypothetical protein BV898_18614 [Hypsibius exemplaris]